MGDGQIWVNKIRGKIHKSIIPYSIKGINTGINTGIKKEPVPCIHGFRGDFISPAKKPGSAYKPLTAFPNLFILSHLQENAPPPLHEYLSSPLVAYGL
jgi:hypothetical protein